MSNFTYSVSAFKQQVACISGLVVEHVLEGGGGAHHVAAGGVHNAQRTGGTGGVEGEQRVLSIHPLDGAVGGHALELVLVPEVAALHEAAVLALHGAHVDVDEALARTRRPRRT